MMYQILDRQVESDLKKRLRALRLPYSAHRILRSSLNQLLSNTSSRAWALPPTKFVDEVRHYSLRHQALKLKGPRPALLNSPTWNFTEELALKLDASIKFLDLARDADLLIKPILLYYSCANICGVYTRAFFRWQNDTRSHGLRCHHVPGKVANTKVIIERKEQFPRLAATCFLLSGILSCFSELVTYSSTPTSHTGPGEFLENFGKMEIGSPITEITLDDLVAFGYGKHLKIVREYHGFHKFKGLPTTAFLIDIITLFVGSSLARYDVIGWREIIEGKSNPYRIHFEETFERFQTSTINYLLTMLEKPEFAFDQAFHPAQPSPYSHSHQIRFKTDPNYVS